MATKGYSSYHGRGSPGKIALIVVLVLILLGAITYLVVQNYLVYDESGQVHLELPFFKPKDGVDTEQSGDGQDGLTDADFDRVEPEFPHVKVSALHGVRLPDDCLWWGADYIMTKLAPEDMVLAVKRTTGGITYATEAQPPQGVVVETGRPLDCLKTLLAADRWTVGHIVCFSDNAFAQARTDCALVRADGGLWYDAAGQAWLDPTDPEVLRYLTALCRECGELGFNEVLLDNFCYPASGDTAAIANDDGDRAQILTDVAKSLRSCLPEGVALSVTYRGGGDLTLAQLADLFDRIYVPAADYDAAAAQLGSQFDADTRLVSMTSQAAEAGSYMLVQ